MREGGSTGGFKRRLSLLDLTLIGVGAIVGSGWLFAALNGALVAGPLAWAAWILGAFVVTIIGIVYAEIGAALPRAGGFVRYPEYTHGSLVGYIIGFMGMLSYSSVAGVEVEAVRQYTQHWWPGLTAPGGNPSTGGFIFQFSLLVLFFLLNYWSVNVFGKVNTVLTLIKFIVPLLTITALLTQFHVSNLRVGGASPGGVNGIFQAVSTAGIVFAFLGFRQAVDFGAEAKNPQRDIPRSIVFAVVISTAIYLLLQMCFIGAVPPQNLTHGWHALAAVYTSPFADIATAVGMGWLSYVIFADAMISPSGTGNVYMSGTARSIYSWAKTGYFYSWFGKINKRTGIPRGALWLTLVLSAMWTMPMHFQLWQGLVGAVTSAQVMTYVMGPVSAGSLRRTMPDLPRPFRLRGLGFWSPVAFVFATLIIYWTGWNANSLLISLIIGSLVLYFAFIDKDELRSRVREWKNGAWLVVYYLFILMISRVGDYTGEGMHVYIPFPWDSIIVAAGAILFYYWGVTSAMRRPRITVDEDEV